MLRSASCLAVAVMLVGAGDVWATPLITHSGATNPELEGWTYLPSENPANTVYPILGDEGFDAWVIDDVAKNSIEYHFYPSGTQLAEAESQGWRMTARIKVGNTPDSVDNGVVFYYISETHQFAVNLGSDSSGDPMVLLGNSTHFGPATTLDGLGGGYHLYEMEYDPGTAEVSLAVDGQPVLSGHDGWALSQTPRAAFLSGGVATGEGRWNFVKFEIIPEPSSIILLATGALGLLACGWRKRRS